MAKQEVKDKMQEAVPQVPHLTDIKWIALFGSYVNGTPSEESDVDVLIDFEPSATIGFFALSDTKNNLEAVPGKPVDLGELL